MVGHLKVEHMQLFIRIYSGGNGVCAGPIASPGDATLHCWDLRGPNPRMEGTWPAKNAGTQPVASSSEAASPLVVFVDSQFRYNAFTERQSRTPRRWLFWNPEAGQIEAEMPIELQTVRVLENLRPVVEPDIVALSPDGRRIARAGNSDLEIFDLP
jgi:hypothetical protein